MSSWEEVVYDPAEEVEEGGRDGWVGSHAVVHHQDGRLNVHDIVLDIQGKIETLLVWPFLPRQILTDIKETNFQFLLSK